MLGLDVCFDMTRGDPLDRRFQRVELIDILREGEDRRREPLGCAPDSCAAMSNNALISGSTNRRWYMRVVISTPCCWSAGAAAFTKAIVSGESGLDIQTCSGFQTLTKETIKVTGGIQSDKERGPKRQACAMNPGLSGGDDPYPDRS
jgi:hypothetical protein